MGGYWIFCWPSFRFLLFRCLCRASGSYFFGAWQTGSSPDPETHSEWGGQGWGIWRSFTSISLCWHWRYRRSFVDSEQISTGNMAFQTLYDLFLMVLLLNAALFIGPHCHIHPEALDLPTDGMSKYMGMASRYVRRLTPNGSRRKTRPANLNEEPRICNRWPTYDSVNVVRNMRLIGGPEADCGTRHLRDVAPGAAGLPEVSGGPVDGAVI